MKKKLRIFWHNFIQAPLLISLLVTAVPFTVYMVRFQADSAGTVPQAVGTDQDGAGDQAAVSSDTSTDSSERSEGGDAAAAGSEGSGGSDGQEDEASQADGDDQDAEKSAEGSDDAAGDEEHKSSFWESIPEEVEEASTEAATIDPALQVIPDGVNSPVMQAVDYGNVNTAYRAPAGTVFEHDRSGIFAPDGTYYYLQSVPDDSYFADALFIGDSRTAGFASYSTLKNVSSFWAKESMSVFNIYNDKVNLVAQGNDQGAMSLDDVLDERQYGKIYVSMGINEIGMPYTTTYVDRYRTILTDIRNHQPDAIIYITGIMHVSQAVSSTDSVTNNPNIVERNEAVVSLTNGRDIFYLDMDPAVCDDNGDLIADLTGDGIHLKASAYERWAEFCRQNAIVRESEEESAEAEDNGNPHDGSTGDADNTGAAGTDSTEGADTGEADMSE